MKKIKILIPVYNDWQSVFKLMENINLEVSSLDFEFSVIIVNDASTESSPEISSKLDNLKNIKIINMKENRGHARCIASGLKYILEKEEFDYVIPMDGDGEDRPEEIKKLVSKLKEYPDKVIVGERVKRSESSFFKVCYFIHKIITYTFTGQSIKFGNYTCLPKSIVEKMINEKATWNSFSGSLAKVVKNKVTIASERGTRYFGPSKMSFINLLKHSFSIISVFKFGVIIKSFIFSAVYLLLILKNITSVTLIPFYLIVILILIILKLSQRENINEFSKSLTNVSDIIDLK